MAKYALNAHKLHLLPLSSIAAGDKSDGKAKLHGDNMGLYVLCEPSTNPKHKDGIYRVFVFKFTWLGEDAVKRMPAVGDISLSEARDTAKKYRRLVEAGKDPRHVIGSTAAGQITLAAYYKQFRDDFIAGQHERAGYEWDNQFEKFTAIHARPIGEITTQEVHGAIKAYWLTNAVTASRALNKLHAIFLHAFVNKKCETNPAVLAHVKALRGGIKAPRKMRPIVHHPALPYADLPAFMKKLAYEDAIAATVLIWCILTSSRSKEARLVKWSWLNKDMTTVTIPKTKNGDAHPIPLPVQLTAILHALPRKGDYIFPTTHSFGSKEPIKADAILKLAKRISGLDITAHGFRSTFRDWTAVNRIEEDFVLELCISHKIKLVEGSARSLEVRAAYQRDKLTERRRPVMQAWADYAIGAAPRGKVVPFNRKAA